MTIQNSISNSSTNAHIPAEVPKKSDNTIKSYLKNVFPFANALTHKTSNSNAMSSPVSRSSLLAMGRKEPASDPVTMRLDSWINEAGSWGEKRERRKFAAEIQPRAEINPEGHLVINEYLHLDSLNKITALPEGLKVNGDFWIFACYKLTSLPANLEVKGCVEIIGSRLVSLPENFKVSGTLGVFRSFELQHIKPGLDVGEDMELYECFKLESMSENGRIGGDFKWHESSEAKSLPENLNVAGSITLSYMPKLASVPTSLKAGGDIRINWCNSMPKNLSLPGVKGEIKFIK